MVRSSLRIGMVLLATLLTVNAFHVVQPLATNHGRVGSFSLSNKVSQRFPQLPSDNFGVLAARNDDDDDDDEPYVDDYSEVDPLVLETSRALRHVSWLSWWAQVILTTVSSVTLLFARNVVTTLEQASPVRRGAENFFLAGSGILASVLSILWTWGGARLSRRILRNSTSRIRVANMIRRAIRVGVSLNLVGMFLTLLGAEQIVGVLAVKVLTMQGMIGNPGSAALATQTLQPLDILIVQANTNTLLSHFCSLVCVLYLIKFVQKLDPPSVENDERKRK